MRNLTTAEMGLVNDNARGAQTRFFATSTDTNTRNQLGKWATDETTAKTGPAKETTEAKC